MLIAQENFSPWRADNERLETFRSRNAAFAWIRAILAAMEHAESLGAGGATAQARPEPTVTFDDRLELTIGGRDLVLFSTPGGETTDSLVIWLPESRTAFTGNLFGAALRARPQPRHHARRPLPRRPDLRRFTGHSSSTWPPTACSPATSTPSTGPTASPPR